MQTMADCGYIIDRYNLVTLVVCLLKRIMFHLQFQEWSDYIGDTLNAFYSKKLCKRISLQYSRPMENLLAVFYTPTSVYGDNNYHLIKPFLRLFFRKLGFFFLAQWSGYIFICSIQWHKGTQLFCPCQFTDSDQKIPRLLLKLLTLSIVFYC